MRYLKPRNPTGSVWARKATHKRILAERKTESLAKLAHHILSEHKLLNGANYIILKPAAAWGAESVEATQRLRSPLAYKQTPTTAEI